MCCCLVPNLDRTHTPFVQIFGGLRPVTTYVMFNPRRDSFVGALMRLLEGIPTRRRDTFQQRGCCSCCTQAEFPPSCLFLPMTMACLPWDLADANVRPRWALGTEKLARGGLSTYYYGVQTEKSNVVLLVLRKPQHLKDMAYSVGKVTTAVHTNPKQSAVHSLFDTRISKPSKTCPTTTSAYWVGAKLRRGLVGEIFPSILHNNHQYACRVRSACWASLASIVAVCICHM